MALSLLVCNMAEKGFGRRVSSVGESEALVRTSWAQIDPRENSVSPELSVREPNLGLGGSEVPAVSNSASRSNAPVSSMALSDAILQLERQIGALDEMQRRLSFVMAEVRSGLGRNSIR